MQLHKPLLAHRRLETLVENQTTHSLANAELHVFETHQQAEQVFLRFHQPVLASMLDGRKVMHLQGDDPFEFLPGESLLLPPDETMVIDFPDAHMLEPTRCLAMTISPDTIQGTLNRLNETHTRLQGEWAFSSDSMHFQNDVAIQQILHRLMFLFAEDHPSKDVFADFMLQELIMRMAQVENRRVLLNRDTRDYGDDRLLAIIQYIRQHLDKPLTITDLSSEACMSESHFHRVFKHELNLSPIEFINRERIDRAVDLLRDPGFSVKEVAAQCGFNSNSYFIRTFKRMQGLTPKAFQDKVNGVS